MTAPPPAPPPVPRRILRTALALAVALALGLLPLGLSAQEVVDEKVALEIARLELELRKLAQETGWLPWLRFVLGALVLPASVVAVGWFLNRQQKKSEREAENRTRALEQQAERHAREARKRHDDDALRFTALTEARIAAYAEAFALTEPTALLFPRAPDGEAEAAADAQVLSRARCAEIGRGLSGWYFGAGGLLMTRDARMAYQRLAEVLALAAECARPLSCFTHIQHGRMISAEEIARARQRLGIVDRLPEGWAFGAGGKEEPNRDFVLIQTLASRFRTALTRDLASRHQPETDEGIPA